MDIFILLHLKEIISLRRYSSSILCSIYPGNPGAISIRCISLGNTPSADLILWIQYFPILQRILAQVGGDTLFVWVVYVLHHFGHLSAFLQLTPVVRALLNYGGFFPRLVRSVPFFHHPKSIGRFLPVNWTLCRELLWSCCKQQFWHAAIDSLECTCMHFLLNIVEGLCLEYVCQIYCNRDLSRFTPAIMILAQATCVVWNRMFFRTSSSTDSLPKSIYFGSLTLGHGQRNLWFPCQNYWRFNIGCFSVGWKCNYYCRCKFRHQSFHGNWRWSYSIARFHPFYAFTERRRFCQELPTIYEREVEQCSTGLDAIPERRQLSLHELDIRCQVTGLQLFASNTTVPSWDAFVYLTCCIIEHFNLRSLYTVDKKSSIFFFRISFNTISNVLSEDYSSLLVQ